MEIFKLIDYKFANFLSDNGQFIYMCICQKHVDVMLRKGKNWRVWENRNLQTQRRKRPRRTTETMVSGIAKTQALNVNQLFVYVFCSTWLEIETILIRNFVSILHFIILPKNQHSTISPHAPTQLHVIKLSLRRTITNL